GAGDNERFVLGDGKWQVTANGKISTSRRLPDLVGSKPLVVLVNEDTRSAAELLAGALRDNGRALVVGTATFGKGVLQNTYSLNRNLHIKVVTARYFLPDGDNVHERGLTPDVAVRQARSGEDLQL